MATVTGPAIVGVTAPGTPTEVTPLRTILNVAAVSITNGVDTTLSFTPGVDTLGGFNAANPTQITVPAGKGGLYAITLINTWGTSSSGSRVGRIMVNGSEESEFSFSASTASTPSVSGTVVLPLAAGDTVAAQVYSSATSGQPINGGTLSVFRIGS